MTGCPPMFQSRTNAASATTATKATRGDPRRRQRDERSSRSPCSAREVAAATALTTSAPRAARAHSRFLERSISRWQSETESHASPGAQRERQSESRGARQAQDRLAVAWRQHVLEPGGELLAAPDVRAV